MCETFVVLWLLSKEIDTASRDQFLDETVCISDNIGKGMHVTYLILAMDNQQSRLAL